MPQHQQAAAMMNVAFRNRAAAAAANSAGSTSSTAQINNSNKRNNLLANMNASISNVELMPREGKLAPAGTCVVPASSKPPKAKATTAEAATPPSESPTQYLKAAFAEWDIPIHPTREQPYFLHPNASKRTIATCCKRFGLKTCVESNLSELDHHGRNDKNLLR